MSVGLPVSDRRFGALTVLVVAFGVALVAAVHGLAKDSRGAEPDRDAVSRFLGTPLPVGASGFAARAEAGIDTRVQATFEAPDAEARAFAEALLGAPLSPGLDPGVAETGPAPPGWPRAAPAGHAGGRADRPGRAYRILAVPADPGRLRLYVVGFIL